MTDADAVRPVLDPAQPRACCTSRAARSTRRPPTSTAASRSPGARRPAAGEQGPAQPGVRRLPGRPHPAGPGRHGAGRRPDGGPRRTRSCCSTGPGCCARRAWPGTPRSSWRSGRRRVPARRAAAGPGRDRPGARRRCALGEGEVVTARRLARAAERIFARRGNGQWQRKAQLLVLQCERMALERQAGRPSPRGAATARGPGPCAGRDCRRRSGSTWRDRPSCSPASACCARAGELDEAATLPPAMRSSDPLPSRLLTREVRALSALQRGNLTRAAAEVRRGLAELGSYQNGFGSLDLRTASAVHGLPLARLGLELAERHDSPAEFFAAVERGRAISIRLASVGPPQRRTDRRAARRPCGAARRRPAASRATRGSADRLAAGARPGGRAAARHPRPRLGARGRRRRRPRLPRQRPGGARPGRPPARTARRSSPTSCTAAGGRPWLASGRRPQLFDLASAAEVDELVQRVRADLDALAMPLLPPPLCPRRCAARSTPGCAGSTTCCRPRSASTGSRSWSRAAQRWCCCPGACCRRGAGSPSS